VLRVEGCDYEGEAVRVWIVKGAEEDRVGRPLPMMLRGDMSEDGVIAATMSTV
jgi:hypothetical protein